MVQSDDERLHQATGNSEFERSTADENTEIGGEGNCIHVQF